MTLEQQFIAALQLAVAAFLGSIIGLERERRQHEAGLRTHMMVAMGSCLFTSLSIYAFPGGDPGRVASQILPGMGFLGAGSIIKYGKDIQGLTTAASMWFTAAMGMAVGTGSWFLALCGVLLAWFVLAVMHTWGARKSNTGQPVNGSDSTPQDVVTLYDSDQQAAGSKPNSDERT